MLGKLANKSNHSITLSLWMIGLSFKFEYTSEGKLANKKLLDIDQLDKLTSNRNIDSRNIIFAQRMAYLFCV